MEYYLLYAKILLCSLYLKKNIENKKGEKNKYQISSREIPFLRTIILTFII